MKIKYPKHICRFNDYPKVCKCYDEGFKAGREELIEEIEEWAKEFDEKEWDKHENHIMCECCYEGLEPLLNYLNNLK